MISECLAEYPEAHADPIILPLHTPFFSSPALFTPTTIPEWTAEHASAHRSVPTEAGVSAGLDFFDPVRVTVARIKPRDVPKGTTYGDFCATPPVLLPDIDQHAKELHGARNGFLGTEHKALTPHAAIRKAKIDFVVAAENQYVSQGKNTQRSKLTWARRRYTERGRALIETKIDNGSISFLPRTVYATITAQTTAALIYVLLGVRDTRTALAARSGLQTYNAIARDPDSPFILKDVSDVDIVKAFVDVRLGQLAKKLAQQRRNATIRHIAQ